MFTFWSLFQLTGSKKYNTLSHVEKQNYEGEIKKSVTFLNSSPEAIIGLIQKVLLSSKTKQKITPDCSPELSGNSVCAKIKSE